jgi:hypothetical protein
MQSAGNDVTLYYICGIINHRIPLHCDRISSREYFEWTKIIELNDRLLKDILGIHKAICHLMLQRLLQLAIARQISLNSASWVMAADTQSLGADAL